MTMFLGNPDLELRIYGEEYQEDYNYIDEEGYEYEYDEFIGKWLKKRKKRRSKKPKVIARRKRRDERRIRKGKEPKYTVQTDPPKKEAIKKETPVVKSKTASNIIPLTKNEAQVHKNTNKAIQEELKTKQEELKTLGMEKKVEQEDLKAEQIKSKTQMASTGKGLIWVVAIVGGIAVLKWAFGGSKDANPTQTVPPAST